MSGYAKQRSNWLDFPSTSTPILAANLNAWEQAIYDLKHENVTIVAASNSPQTANADYICDGTADQVEINAAITAVQAGVSSARIVCCPGTYNFTAAIDFSPLAATGDVPVVFDAAATIFRADANLTSLVNIGYTGTDAAGQWLQNRLIGRFGTITGLGHTVTQGVFIQRCMDNDLSFHNIANISGNGVTVDQSTATSAGTFNNLITIAKLSTNGTGFKVLDTTTGAMHFQGNTVRCSHAQNNGVGFQLGTAVNQHGDVNRFEIGVIEGTTNAAIDDRTGANVWIVNNVNSNGSPAITCPASMTYPSTFIIGRVDSGQVIDANVIAQHYLLVGGRIRAVEFFDGGNLAVGATTGTKIGTSSGQKLSFYGNTAVVQPSTTGTATGFTAGAGTAVNDASTFTGAVGSTAYRISDIVKHLKNLGLIAQ